MKRKTKSENVTEQETQAILGKIPQPPPDAVFSLLKVEKVAIPHPYCITPKHVKIAADHYGGMLGESAIEDAERAGAKCDICRQQARKNGSRILTYREHENSLTLYIQVPQNRDLNAVFGLHAYLLSIRDLASQLGIQGFAFPAAG